MILNWELRDILPELRPEGRLNLLITFILHANSRLRCWPSVERLMDETGFFGDAVTAAKKWLLDRGAIVLVPFGQRVGPEKKLPARQHVYQLTGVIMNATGKYVRYLYLTPEAENDLRAALEQLDIPATGNPASEIPLTGGEGVSTIQGGYTSQDNLPLARQMEEGEDTSTQSVDEDAESDEENDTRVDAEWGAPDQDESVRYVTDPFEEEGQKRPKWAIPDGTDVLLMRALAACKRKFFQKGEKTQWRQVRQALIARKMSQAWVEHCTIFAEAKQSMPFPNLVKWILNPEKMVDWEQKRAGRTQRTSGGVSAGPED